MPPASIDTSQSGALPDPIETILPSSATMVSPAAIGDVISPDKIFAMLKIAIFITSGSLHGLARGGLFVSESANTGVQPAAICQTKDNGDFIRHRCIRQHQRHPVIVRADVNVVLVVHRDVDRRAGAA